MSAPTFAASKGLYAKRFVDMKISPQHAVIVDATARRVLQAMADTRMDEVSAKTGVPKAFIALSMLRESDLNWGCHLHNGDSLQSRTHNVPAGRPPVGSPPFDWATSAVDALIYEGYNQITDWGIERVLYCEEQYNGWGYWNMGRPSAYIWSYSDQYVSGKYTSDNHYEAGVVDNQLGVAVVLKRMIEIDPSSSPAVKKSVFAAVKDSPSLGHQAVALVMVVFGYFLDGWHHIVDAMTWAVETIPVIGSDLDSLMSPAERIAHSFNIPFGKISLAIAAASVFLSIYRQLPRKQAN